MKTISFIADGIEQSIPAKYEVCDHCRGEGTHVNPSVDANGLTYDDFAADPDFKDNYFSGLYDVRCEECNGTRVVLVPDESQADKEVWAAYWRMQEELWAMEAEREAERRIGA